MDSHNFCDELDPSSESTDGDLDTDNCAGFDMEDLDPVVMSCSLQWNTRM